MTGHPRAWIRPPDLWTIQSANGIFDDNFKSSYFLKVARWVFFKGSLHHVNLVDIVKFACQSYYYLCRMCQGLSIPSVFPQVLLRENEDLPLDLEKQKRDTSCAVNISVLTPRKRCCWLLSFLLFTFIFQERGWILLRVTHSFVAKEFVTAGGTPIYPAGRR